MDAKGSESFGIQSVLPLSDQNELLTAEEENILVNIGGLELKENDREKESDVTSFPGASLEQTSPLLTMEQKVTCEYQEEDNMDSSSRTAVKPAKRKEQEKGIARHCNGTALVVIDAGRQTADIEHAAHPCPGPQSNSLHTPPAFLKKNQPSAAQLRRKSLLHNNIKPSDEEDTCSVASSTTGSSKASKTRSVIVSAPVFRSTARAEKRKEYFSMLEEKHRVMEAEKSQIEAKTKEAREAELKQLRKSLTYKANPIPSFYYAPLPPKIELKKPPTTCPKSPKFGRRKSCDAVSSKGSQSNAKSPTKKVDRHSVGSYRSATSSSSSFQKDKAGANDPVKKLSCMKDGNKVKATEENVHVPPVNVTGPRSIGISVQCC